MSIEAAEATIPGSLLGGAVSGLEIAPELPPVSRSLGRQAVIDTLGRTSAQVGLSWLIVLAFFAVFAPFVANTHPILMKLDGRWSSPLLKNLTRVDVLLLVLTATTIALVAWRRFPVTASVGILAAVLVLAGIPCWLLVHPPENVGQ